MRRSVSILGLVAVLALGIGGLLRNQKSSLARAQEQGSTAEVKIDNFNFGPSSLTVVVGTAVTWTNRDDIPHTVVSTDDAKTFKSKVLDTDEKFLTRSARWEHTPTICSIHPKMTGKVTVQYVRDRRFRG